MLTVDPNIRQSMVISVLLLIQATFLFGQDVEFITKVDRDSVPIGQAFKIEFQLRNAQGVFKGPDLSDFQIIGGPNYMSSYSMINGESTIELTYSYILEGKEEGTFTIGPASVETSDKLLESDPVRITIYFDPDTSTDTPKKENTPSIKRKNSIRI